MSMKIVILLKENASRLNVVARAKRGRVFENEYEKANRGQDTTRPGHPKSKSATWREDAKKPVSKSFISIFSRLRTSGQIDNFDAKKPFHEI